MSASPDKIKVFLCGEGSNELGSRIGHRSYQSDDRPGVLHIQRAPATITSAPEIIGGVAVPTLEGWILAMLGARRTEDMAPKRAEETLAQHGVAQKDGAAMVRVVEEADLAKLPEDASSLRLWLSRAAAALPRIAAQRGSA